jgi:chromosome segregation protein
VTLEGDVVTGGGAITGGAPIRRGVIGGAGAAAQVAQEEAQRRQSVEQARQELDQAAQSMGRAEGRWTAAQAQAARRQEAWAQAQEEVRQAKEEEERLRTQLAQEGWDPQEKGDAPTPWPGEAADASTWQRWQEEAERRRSRLLQLEAEVRALHQRHREVEEDLRALGAAPPAPLPPPYEAALAEAYHRLCGSTWGEVERAAGQLAQTLALLGHRLAAQAQALASMGQALRQQDQALERRWAQAQEAARALQEEVVRDWGPELLSLPVPSSEEMQRAQREVQELGRLRARLGPVWPQAQKAHEEERKRLQELEAEWADLQESRQALLQLAQTLGRRIRERVRETAAQVDGAFAQAVAHLLGGKGQVILGEEGGVEVRVVLPGRKPLPLAALSGGERSLGALAFLLALRSVRPGALCVLDEADAALDPANAARLARYLRAHVDRQPFLVITHQRAMMEEADALVGVTSQEEGVSTLVAVRLREEEQDEAAWMGREDRSWHRGAGGGQP